MILKCENNKTTAKEPGDVSVLPAKCACASSEAEVSIMSIEDPFFVVKG